MKSNVPLLLGFFFLGGLMIGGSVPCYNLLELRGRILGGAQARAHSSTTRKVEQNFESVAPSLPVCQLSLTSLSLQSQV